MARSGGFTPIPNSGKFYAWPKTTLWPAVGFITTIALLSSSFATEWFAVMQTVSLSGREQSTKFQATYYEYTETTFGIRGVVQRSVDTKLTFYEPLQVGLSASRAIGVLDVSFDSEFNVWAGNQEHQCNFYFTDTLDAPLSEYDKVRPASARIANQTCALLALQMDAPGPFSCANLSARAREPLPPHDAAWMEEAVCGAGRAVSGLTAAGLAAASLSLVLCFACEARPAAIAATGSLVVLLSALAVVVYGNSISSTYPWQALQTSLLEATSGVKVRADVARVRTGFALSIAASVFSTVGSGLVAAKLFLTRLPPPPTGAEELVVAEGVAMNLLRAAADGGGDAAGQAGGTV